MNLDIFRRRVEVEARRADLEAQLEAVEGELKQLDEEVVREFEENPDMPEVNVSGRTISLKNDYYPKVLTDKQALCAVLKGTGLGQYVQETCNLTSLRGYTNELVYKRLDELGSAAAGIDPAEALPEFLRPHLGISHVLRVNSVKARAKT